jgi:hypothetical protein
MFLVHETTIFQVLAKDYVFAGVEHYPNVSSIRSARNMVVNLSVRSLVLRHKFVDEVLYPCIVIAVATSVVGEGWIITNILGLDLLGEKIAFIQEQNQRGPHKKSVVTNILKKVQCLDLRWCSSEKEGRKADESDYTIQ